jgi:hypothetical protein
MNKSQQVKLESLYRKHVSALKRKGKAEKTIDARLPLCRILGRVLVEQFRDRVAQ